MSLRKKQKKHRVATMLKSAPKSRGQNHRTDLSQGGGQGFAQNRQWNHRQTVSLPKTQGHGQRNRSTGPLEAEILAPVGGEQQLEAAILAGADAVYFGGSSFNARQYAHNFSHPATVVEKCHDAGLRAYLTLNVLVRDDEWKSISAVVDQAASAGVDGVIVQDLGVAALIRQRYPDMPLHASTQMTVHNLEGVRLLEEMGFSQVVLARELTLKEVERIAAGTSLRLEVFVHGALCMSVSGACYFSGMLGERSGNRGSCAQTCRLPFQSAARPYALSLKDMSHIRHIPDLVQAGVFALKIEGRMKSPAYVYAAVRACREALEGRQPDMKQLQEVFSRSGFTDGYLLGKRDLSMFGRRTVADKQASRTAEPKRFPKRQIAEPKVAIPTICLQPKMGDKPFPLPFPPVREKGTPPAVWAKFTTFSQMPKDLKADALILPVEALSPKTTPPMAGKVPVILELPPLVFPLQENALYHRLSQLKSQGFTDVLVHNLGPLRVARELGLTLHGGYGLNLQNSAAIQIAADLGLTDATASFELLLPKIMELSSSIPIGAVVYGRLPLMQLRTCPAQGTKGCGNCGGRPFLTDRKGVGFPLICHGRQFVTVHNHLPIYIGDCHLKGLSHCIFLFTTESAHQCSRILQDFQQSQKPDFSYTRGPYRRKLL